MRRAATPLLASRLAMPPSPTPPAQGKTLPDMANVNEHITDQLSALVEHYDENKEDKFNAFRASNTKQAVQFLKRLPRRLNRIGDLDTLLASAPPWLRKRIKIGESTRACDGGGAGRRPRTVGQRLPLAASRVPPNRT